MSFQEKITLNPIGYVKTEAVGMEIKDKSSTSQIVLREDLVEGLEGIAEFSYIFVLFYLHQTTSQQRLILKVHPRGRMDLPLLGVFATRTMLRPNPIGLTLVELLQVEGNVLTVRVWTPTTARRCWMLNPMIPGTWQRMRRFQTGGRSCKMKNRRS